MANQVMYDGRWISTDTTMGKEVLKFQQPNYNPDANPYPKMLYKAAMSPSGQVRVFEKRPDMALNSWKDAELQRENDRCDFFDRANQKTVGNESEHKEALNQGWRDHPDDALKHYEERERSIGNAAAERAHRDSKMSEAAQAEAKAADDATEFHLPEIPEKKLDKRTKAYKDSVRS